jgi:lipid-binding SYLF domain-containing protein
MSGSVRGERVEPGFNPIQSSQKRRRKITMNPKWLLKQVNRCKPLSAVLIGMILIGIGMSSVYAATVKEINASVDASLDRFYEQVKGAREFGKNAKGLLVLPNVKKAALLIGGEYGEGALRIGGESAGYYNIVSGSFGLQIGAESKDIIIAFMTDEALNSFRASKGWEVGIDGNVAFITVGGGDRVDTTTTKDPIVGFVFDVKGLIADISLKGAKITRLDK